MFSKISENFNRLGKFWENATEKKYDNRRKETKQYQEGILLETEDCNIKGKINNKGLLLILLRKITCFTNVLLCDHCRRINNTIKTKQIKEPVGEHFNMCGNKWDDLTVVVIDHNLHWTDAKQKSKVKFWMLRLKSFRPDGMIKQIITWYHLVILPNLSTASH